ncbi:chorismate mutase [Actinomycetospora chibensis]|uniref:Chorismate mutase n=1 Tax=Actinomycetospora chibensis TaxID=663606 RepID=A0ABV9RJU3_9PSEU|nr:chorismate mutase [Actinomycetospora chibensis]MDD7925952.1 chorismate mutase [Actinomycetospora chibensis]
MTSDPAHAPTSDAATAAEPAPEGAPETAPEDGQEGAPEAAAPLAPATAEEIPALREEIDAIDAELLRLVRRRSEISQRIGLARMAAGGPRIVYNREMQVLARFRGLGTEGRELAMLLLRLGRGRLGGRS